MTAREVAKWHGKACVVTLKQGSVLVCEKAMNISDKTLFEFRFLDDWLLLSSREIKSIKARKL